MIGKDAQAHLLEAVLEEMKRARVKVQGFRAQHFTYDCELKMSSIPDAPMNTFRGDGAADMQTSEEDYPF